MQGGEAITIGKSRRGQWITLVAVLLPASLLPMSGFDLLWVGLGELTLSLIAWHAWRSTIGLGQSATLTLIEGQWLLARSVGEAQSIDQIRAGYVSPGFLSARLKTGRCWLNLVAFADAQDATQHWYLRRLVLRGPENRG